MTANAMADVPKHMDDTGTARQRQELSPEHPPNETRTAATVNMVAYRQNVSFRKRFYQHSLTQMMLLSMQAFCGPAMADAIAGLGGGGLATPQTSNIAYVLETVPKDRSEV